MASSLLALLDDISTLLDDVAVLTKVATKKTAGVLGDDLALNAQQVTGVSTERELPVVFAVAKGSLLNKLVLIPLALGVSALVPWAVTPLLMVGGAFLCFEGVEKLLHKFLDGPEAQAHAAKLHEAVLNPAVDLLALEKEKVKGAIRTDFILSAEIIAISLGTVVAAPWVTQLGVLAGMGLLMTVGVYGLVAGIVKLDDAGLALSRRGGGLGALGRAVLWAMPWLMKALSVAGTAAMFLVGGGILTHGLPAVHPWFEAQAERLGAPWQSLVLPVGNALVGVVAGAVVVALVLGGKRLFPKRAKAAP